MAMHAHRPSILQRAEAGDDVTRSSAYSEVVDDFIEVVSDCGVRTATASQHCCHQLQSPDGREK